MGIITDTRNYIKTGAGAALKHIKNLRSGKLIKNMHLL